MKKIITIILTVLSISSLFCFTAFADGASTELDYIDNLPAPAPATVLRVAGLNKSGELVHISDDSDISDGWNTAMDNATPSKLEAKGFAAIVVSLYSDWNADSDGVFHDGGKGFDWDTIYVPEDAKVILNLNGHTINRGLTEWENNGEVIAIDENASVVINGGCSSKDKTEGAVTGGYSAQYGGGIHIKEGANVTLNNVNVVGNRVEDASGAGISVAKGTTLTMNGGSVSNNKLEWTYNLQTFNNDNNGVGVYASKNTTLVFNDVDFKSNTIPGGKFSGAGAAIYTRMNVDVTINNCLFEGNGKKVNKGGMAAVSTLRFEEDCDVEVNNSVFKDNGDIFYIENVGGAAVPTELIMAECEVDIDSCTFENNNSGYLFFASEARLKITNCLFKNNSYVAGIFFSNSSGKGLSEFNKCTFTGNTLAESSSSYNYDIAFISKEDVSNLKFVDCSLDRPMTSNDLGVIFEISADEDNYFIGSIIGDSSFAVIIALASLCISICAVVILFVDKNKSKKLAAVKDDGE